jgi:hypothetical protein
VQRNVAAKFGHLLFGDRGKELRKRMRFEWLQFCGLRSPFDNSGQTARRWGPVCGVAVPSPLLFEQRQRVSFACSIVREDEQGETVAGRNFRWTNCPRHPFLRAQIRSGKPKVRYKVLATRSRPRRDLRAFALPPPEAPRRNACEDETLAS